LKISEVLGMILQQLLDNFEGWCVGAREDIVKELTEKFGEKNPNVATENMR